MSLHSPRRRRESHVCDAQSVRAKLMYLAEHNTEYFLLVILTAVEKCDGITEVKVSCYRCGRSGVNAYHLTIPYAPITSYRALKLLRVQLLPTFLFSKPSTPYPNVLHTSSYVLQLTQHFLQSFHRALKLLILPL